MGIRLRITGVEALYGKRLENVREYLSKFSKDRPAVVAKSLYDAVLKTKELADFHDHVKAPDIVLGEDTKSRIVGRGDLREVYNRFQNQEADITELAETVGKFLGD